MNSAAPTRSRAGFLCFQAGAGAVSVGILGLWLTDPSGEIRPGSLLPPLLFGFGIPGLLGWLTLTVASPFFSAPLFRRLIGWVPAAASVILLIGHLLALRMGLHRGDLVLSTGMAGVCHLAMILVAAGENGTQPPTFPRRGAAVFTGLLAGIVLGGSIGLAAGDAGTFTVAALAFGLGGLLLVGTGRSPRSPWILAERSIGRFARLVDLLGTEAKARHWLLLFGALFGLTTAALAWLPALWSPLESLRGDGDFGPGPVALVLGGWLAGWAAGSLAPPSRSPEPGRGRRAITPLLVLLGLGGLALLARDPVTMAGSALLVGLPLGRVGRRCREAWLAALDRKGARLPRESEAAIGATLCGGLLLIGGLFAVGEWLLGSPLPPTILFVSGFLLLAFLSWRLGNATPAPAGPAGDDRRAGDGGRSLDPYLPGFAPPPASPSLDDGRSVTILYEIPLKNLAEFREAMAKLGRVRRREGALQWRLSRDLEKPERFTESYLLESWADYQEAIRHETPADRAIKQRVFDLNDWDSLPYESHRALEEI